MGHQADFDLGKRLEKFQHLMISHYADSVTLLSKIHDQGFRLMLTGGSVRDFLLHGKLSDDLDFELTYKDQLTSDEWHKKREQLIDFLNGEGMICKTAPKFGVIQFDLDGLNLELAPARIEFFNKDNNERFGHSDFQVEFMSVSNTQKSFLRRDFTINAIGFKFGFHQHKLSVAIEDPLNGVSDLKNKVLNPCSDDFKHDPVRFARAIRFALKLDFEYSHKLLSLLKTMNLCALTSYYFFYEGFKVAFFEFCSTFFNFIEENNIPVNKSVSELSFLRDIKGHYEVSHHEDVLMALVREGATKDSLEIYRRTAGVKKSVLVSAVKNAY